MRRPHGSARANVMARIGPHPDCWSAAAAASSVAPVVSTSSTNITGPPGPLTAAKHGSVPVVTRRGNEEPRSLHTIIKWPQPLTALFPPGSGIGDLHALAIAKKIAEQSQTDMKSSLREARIQVAMYVSDGETDLLRHWFLPLYAKEGETGALFAAETRFGLSAHSLDEAVQSENWRRVLNQSVPVRRAWGATGLLWALFLERLEERRVFRNCERCGRIIHGKKGKRFCNHEDDAQCYRRRRANDRRRERDRRKETC